MFRRRSRIGFFCENRNLTVFRKNEAKKIEPRRRSRIGFFCDFFNHGATDRRSRIGFFCGPCKNRVKLLVVSSCSFAHLYRRTSINPLLAGFSKEDGTASFGIDFRQFKVPKEDGTASFGSFSEILIKPLNFVIFKGSCSVFFWKAKILYPNVITRYLY